MRTTFGSKEIAHVWVSGEVPEGRSPSAMSFSGHTFFSYGEPIAQRFAGRDAQPVYVLQGRKFSVTTSRHQGRVAQAIPSDTRQFAFMVADITDPRSIMEGGRERVAQLLEAAVVARQPKRGRLMGEAQQLVAQLEAFVDAMPSKALPRVRDRAIPKVPGSDAELAEIHNKWFESEKRRKRAEAKREAERAKARAEEWAVDRERWLAGGRTHSSDWSQHYPIELRLIGHDAGAGIDGVVETSWGAQVPVVEALELLRRVEGVRASGHDWRWDAETGPGPSVGWYNVNAISAQGDVRVGCHEIGWAQIERFKPVLEVALAEERP